MSEHEKTQVSVTTVMDGEKDGIVRLSRDQRVAMENTEVIHVKRIAPKARFMPEAFFGMDSALVDRIKQDYKDGGYATDGSAAFDLRYVSATPLVLQPGETVKVHTGLSIYLKHPNLVGLVVPRSGLGCKGMVLGNLVAVIDSDYQGEIILALWNRNETETGEVMVIEPGERVAQYIVTECFLMNMDWVEEYDETTARGEQGFGHSGRR